MRLIDADALVFEYEGLAKIHPSDGHAIAEYFANQVKAMPTIEPEMKLIPCSLVCDRMDAVIREPYREDEA